MTSPPHSAPADEDAPDAILVARARNGDRDALDQLIRRHQAWIFNLALRMVWLRARAEDATQEILIKAVTKLDAFRGESAFRTWLYRIAVNHLLNVQQARPEAQGVTFVEFGRGMDADPDLEPPDQSTVAVDVRLLVEETRHACMNGMLLCLDRRQRVAYILGEIFGETSEVGGAAMDESPENFRQLLSRARRDLYQFMHDKCGLVNQANPCRCAKKTRAFMNAGYVDPLRLQFKPERIAAVRDLAPERLDDLSAMDREHARMFRENAFSASPDYAAKLRTLIGQAGFDRTDAAAPAKPAES
jgi:RNA polymerase sigma factor (sigma-70 family)